MATLSNFHLVELLIAALPIAAGAFAWACRLAWRTARILDNLETRLGLIEKRDQQIEQRLRAMECRAAPPLSPLFKIE